MFFERDDKEKEITTAYQGGERKFNSCTRFGRKRKNASKKENIENNENKSGDEKTK